MSDDLDIVCVIPARSGSKGIPGKNLVQFRGRPLLQWSIDAALESGRMKRVIVSTDDTEIADVARAAGAEVPDLRPPALATDDVHAYHVVEHVLSEIRRQHGTHPSATMMLLPTSPMRRAADVSAAIDLLENTGAPAVISVSDLGKYMTNLRFLEDNELVRVAPEENPNAQRQGLKKLYGVNGSIFLARTAALLAAGTFHLPHAAGYVMPSERSVDINSQEDLAFAERLARTLESEASSHGTA